MFYGPPALSGPLGFSLLSLVDNTALVVESFF